MISGVAAWQTPHHGATTTVRHLAVGQAAKEGPAGPPSVGRRTSGSGLSAGSRPEQAASAAARTSAAVSLISGDSSKLSDEEWTRARPGFNIYLTAACVLYI